MRRNDYQRLSKTVSHALRHEPWVYDLELDEEGWVNIEDLMNALRTHMKWRGLALADIQEMNSLADKQRFEVKEGRIRALYGHSFKKKIKKDPSAPPEFLYHGTSPDLQESILKDGLSSMGRQYVHLSHSRKDAWNVGRRKSTLPVVLVVDAKAAHDAGVKFYIGNEDIWLADEVPAKFIRTDENEV